MRQDHEHPEAQHASIVLNGMMIATGARRARRTVPISAAPSPPPDATTIRIRPGRSASRPRRIAPAIAPSLALARGGERVCRRSSVSLSSDVWITRPGIWIWSSTLSSEMLRMSAMTAALPGVSSSPSCFMNLSSTPASLSAPAAAPTPPRSPCRTAA